MVERYVYADFDNSAIYADYGDDRTATVPEGTFEYDHLVHGVPPSGEEGDEGVPPKTIEPYVPDPFDLVAYAAMKRWDKETGGITMPNGLLVRTDPIAQEKISSMQDAFVNHVLKGTVDFKSDSGWVTVDSSAATVIYEAVVSHVQTCYALERTVAEQITAGEITTAEQVDNAFV